MRPSSMETTVYMPLLNEGTDVWRPVKARAFGSGLYRITERQADEEWAFASGAIVVVDNSRRIIAVANS